MVSCAVESKSVRQKRFGKGMAGEVLERDYMLLDRIGQGHGGVVIYARRRRDLRDVAVKVIKTDNLSEAGRAGVENEVNVLRCAYGDRIVELIDDFQDGPYTCIVMEYLPGGDLCTRLWRRSSGFSEVQALRIIESVLDGLACLHEQGIAHRDLKLDNIMLADEKDCASIKLIDFGLSHWRKLSTDSEYSTRQCGTLAYLPPQIAAGKPYVPEQCDMWSLGVVMYALLAKRMPFPSSCRTQLLEAIERMDVQFEGPQWRNVSDGTKQLVRLLLSKNASERPSAAQCLQTVRGILRTKEIQVRDSSIPALLSPRGSIQGGLNYLLETFFNAPEITVDAVKAVQV